MPDEQVFVVMGEPKAQGRPRFARMGKFVKAYDPKDSRENKGNIRAQIVAHHPVMIDRDKAILCHVQAYFSRPKAHYNKKGIRDNVPLMKATKPDAENILKAIMDALTGIVWVDDAQVADCRLIKMYGETPKMIITVAQL